jgi:FtsP/CotA-like multicopper oxidase with cupredoxin domain
VHLPRVGDEADGQGEALTLPPFSRRGFLGAAGATWFCTLTGHKLHVADGEADIGKLAAGIPVPPKVAEAEAAPAPVARAAAGVRREYWIRAEKTRWTIVPTRRDQMMDERIHGPITFNALAYRAYAPNFAKPLGPATIPGPLLTAEVGDSIVVNFQNATPGPVTMHPHGLFYRPEMDGAYKGRYTDPGGFVQKGKTFQYVWDCHPDSVGYWPYHDHGPLDPLPVFKGLIGAILVRDPAVKQPDVEFPLVFHSFQPQATGFSRAFSCINGRAYAGNTPTLQAKAGQDVAFHVIALDNDFHTFHVHGHRWREVSGRVIDNVTLGPGDSYTARFVEDNPGRWLYHCHVFSHIHMGMTGWYLVSP